MVSEGGGLYEFGVTAPHPKLEEYDALLFVLTGADHWELCVMPLDEPRTHFHAHVVTPKVWALDLPELAGRPVAAFGPQGDWVLVSLPEGISFLAGEPGFVKRVLERAGGPDELRSRFEAWVAEASIPDAPINWVSQLAGWR